MISGLRTSSRYVPGVFMPCFQPKRSFKTQQEDLHYYHLITTAGCKRNLSELSPTQQELISIAELFCFRYRFSQQRVRKQTLENVFPLLASSQLSRIEGGCDKDVFNTGIYATQNRAAGDPVEYHLDRGGDSSLFRGATTAQSEAITHQEGDLIRYHAILFFRGKCAWLKSSIP